MVEAGKEKARRDETRQDKTRQDKTRQDETRQMNLAALPEQQAHEPGGGASTLC